MQRITIANIPVDLLSERSLERRVDELMSLNRTAVMLYANSNAIQLANGEEPWMIDFYNVADLVLCDGAGVQLAAKITGQPVPDKIAFNTWFWRFLNFIENKYSLFLLGGSQEVIELTFQKFKNANPQLIIAGYHNGYFDKEDEKVNREIIRQINESKADILLIGLGQPMQELWVKKNFEHLESKLIITCGGAFDFFSGRMKVAPLWMRKLWLEWLFRLMGEPARLLKRYTLGNLSFLKLVLKQRMKH